MIMCAMQYAGDLPPARVEVTQELIISEKNSRVTAAKCAKAFMQMLVSSKQLLGSSA